MRLKIRDDAFWLPESKDEVLFRSAEHLIQIKGKNIYTIFERIIPFLNGQYDMERVLGRLKKEHQYVIHSLLDTLQSKGFLTEHNNKMAHELPPEELQAFNAHISLIGLDQDSPEYRFQLFRNTRLLIVGKGHTLSSTILSAVQNGMKNIDFINLDDDGSVLEFVKAQLDHLRESMTGHIDTMPEYLPQQRSNERFLEIIGEYDVVVYIGFDFHDHLMEKVSLACVEHNVEFISATALSDEIFVGPYTNQDNKLTWQSLYFRLAQRIKETSVREDSRFIPVPAASIAGGLLIYEILKNRTGVSPNETNQKGHIINLENLEIKSFRLIKVQHAPIEVSIKIVEETQVLEDMQQSIEKDDGLIDDEDEQSFVERVTLSIVDPLTGPISEIDEKNLWQIPINQCTATVSVPGLQKEKQLISYGHSPIQARANVLHESIDYYINAIAKDHLLYYAKMSDDRRTWAFYLNNNSNNKKTIYTQDSLDLSEVPDNGTVITGASSLELVTKATLRLIAEKIHSNILQYNWKNVDKRRLHTYAEWDYLQEYNIQWLIEEVEDPLLTVYNIKIEDEPPIVFVHSTEVEANREVLLYILQYGINKYNHHDETYENRPLNFSIGNNVRMEYHAIQRLSKHYRLQPVLVPLSIDELKKSNLLSAYIYSMS